jgi:glycerol-3-phosphate acyltransferase PlsX
VQKVQSPLVALANNGAEETKGTQLQLDAYPLLQNSGLHFIGNIEARDIPAGAADVVVCDGFTGNIILKLTEGVARMMNGMIKEMIYQSAKTKLAGLLLKGGLAGFKKKMDYTEYGGAPLLGIKKPVIKAHGSSNAVAIKNAVRQAKTCAEKDVAGAIEAWIAQHKQAGGERGDADGQP